MWVGQVGWIHVDQQKRQRWTAHVPNPGRFHPGRPFQTLAAKHATGAVQSFRWDCTVHAETNWTTTKQIKWVHMNICIYVYVYIYILYDIVCIHIDIQTHPNTCGSLCHRALKSCLGLCTALRLLLWGNRPFPVAKALRWHVCTCQLVHWQKSMQQYTFLHTNAPLARTYYRRCRTLCCRLHEHYNVCPAPQHNGPWGDRKTTKTMYTHVTAPFQLVPHG